MSTAEIEDLKPCVNRYKPIPIQVTPGETKYWCRCGLSKNQPFCDGSHKGTGIGPLAYTVPEDKTQLYFCQCKYSKNKPLCDGSHRNLKEGYEKCIQECTEDHAKVEKLCVKCGFSPQFPIFE